MTTTSTLRALTLCSTLLVPLAAAAQDAGPPVAAASSADDPTAAYTGAIEAGVGFLSSSSFRFGKYTGLTDKGAFGVGNVVIRKRDAWDSGGGHYWQFVGTNLGLTSREISGKGGKQGRWGASLFYNQIPFYQSDSAVTIFGNVGGATLTLPTNLPTNTNPTLGLQLLPFLHPQDFSLDRKIVGGGLSVQPATEWQFSTNVSHEHKDGIKEQSLSVNVRTDPTFFPEPVNYDTDTLEASAAYNRQAVQLQFGYNFSNFTNNNAAVLLPSPFVGVVNQGVGALSQWALPASSVAHEVNVASAYNISPTTRVNVNLGYGVQLQNEPLLPYTRNLNFPVDPLPRSSLDGKVQTYMAQFKATAQPAPKFDLSASYTYDKRANHTPQNPYMSMQEPEWVKLLMWSVPYGFTNQIAKLDASQRFLKGTRLAGTYEYRRLERTFAEVTQQTENNVRAKLSQDFGVGTSYVSYLYGSRTGSAYQPYAFDLALGNLPSTTPLLPYPNNAEFSGYNLEPNFYLFRRFFEADRTRKEVKAGSSFDIAQALSLELFGRRTQDDYTNSLYGITDADSWSTDADLAYTYEKSLEIHGFYTYESIASSQTSLASTGIVTNTPTEQWTWRNNYQDRVHTLGLGATWQIIEDVLKAGPRFEMSYATTDINPVSGPGAGTSAQYVSKPVPTIVTSSRGLKVFAEYTFRPNASFRVVYDFEHLDTEDPALNTGPMPNTAATSLTGVRGAASYGWLLGGDTSGAYDIHVISASVIWRF
jgi:MtrB/PioB family decaheme-associated outer membrane protein